MFEGIVNFFKKLIKTEKQENSSKDTAKERLHLVLMQDRANVSADFLELMKQEIIEVIKKYIEVDEKSIDVRLTNKVNEDGTNGAPALYANIPIVNIKNENKSVEEQTKQEPQKQQEEKKETEIKEKTEEKQEPQENKNENNENKVENKVIENVEKVEIKEETEKNEIQDKTEENKTE